jgi:hypothetical protein
MKAVRDCACGCGGLTHNTFKPGHDQKLLADLAHQLRLATGDNDTHGVLLIKRAVEAAMPFSLKPTR